MKGKELAKEIESKLILEQNVEYARWVKSYMKDVSSFLGVTSPKRKEIALPLLKSKIKEEKGLDYEFIDICIHHEYREMFYTGLEYLSLCHKQLEYEDIKLIDEIIHTNPSWDTVDSTYQLLRTLLDKDSRTTALMIAWSTNDNMWNRRASILCQLRRVDFDADLFETCATNNFGTQLFFINKAIGWLLRELGKHKPSYVWQFLDKYEAQMAKLSIREAKKYLV
jgi:3-methyladenine DNA glycosylase AlkD